MIKHKIFLEKLSGDLNASLMGKKIKKKKMREKTGTHYEFRLIFKTVITLNHGRKKYF